MASQRKSSNIGDSAKKKKTRVSAALLPSTSDDETSIEEYDVEAIVGKRNYKGKLQYCIKWLGYPTSDNTWQDVDTMDCFELINAFELKQNNQKSSPTNSSKKSPIKSAMKSSSPLKSSPKKSPVKASGVTSSPIKRNSSPINGSPMKKNSSSSPKRIRSVRKYKKVNSKKEANSDSDIELEEEQEKSQVRGVWEDQVDQVDTIMKRDGNLIAILCWKPTTSKGRIRTTEERVEECNQKCPQKMLQFYESRLRFPSSDSISSR